MKYKYILFDLDGTLTESAPGIVNSVKYTYERYGIAVRDNEDLEKYVGPPLIESFMKYAGFDRKKASEAVDVYREYFTKKGMFENSVYPGVKDCLEKLASAGLTLAVATSKPEVFCIKILDHFGLRDYFSVVKGIPLDGEDMTKAQVIGEALRLLNPDDPGDCVMVGDRDYDVFGAKENGLPCLGVLYGYGSKDELEKAGAIALFGSAEELAGYLLSE